MDNEQTSQSGTQPDPVDALLFDASDRALTDPDNPEVCERVMNRIIRQQQHRTLIVGLLGIAAAVLAALAALPLIGLLDDPFSFLTGIRVLSEGHAGLPAAVLLALGVAVGWLFLEEAL